VRALLTPSSSSSSEGGGQAGRQAGRQGASRTFRRRRCVRLVRTNLLVKG